MAEEPAPDAYESELQMVELQARAEWKDAGFHPDAFSMDAYNREILTKEMGKQDQEWRFNDISGVSFLAEKRAIIDKMAEDKIVPRVKKFAGKLLEGAAVQMLNAGVEVAGIFEPGFMRRARQRRRHLGRIQQAEADADRVIMERAEAQERRKQWAALVKEAKRARDERVANQGPTSKITHDVEAVADEERRLAEMQMFRERSMAVLEQKTNLLVAKQEAHVVAKEQRVMELRVWRQDYWTKASEAAAADSQDLISAAAEERLLKERELLAFDDAEIADRELQRTYDQVAGPSVSEDPSGLGVFGIPWERGEEAAHGQNRVPGADDAEVQLFSAPPQSAFEEEVLKLHDVQAAEARAEDLYASLQKEVQTNEKEISSLNMLRHRVKAECQQQEEDVKLYTQTLFGPPRRDPAPHQVEANHARKKRIRALKERLQQIDSRCAFLRDSKASAASQSMEVAKQVAVARAAREAMEEEVLGINEGLGELPMVLGRSLHKIPGGVSELQSRPAESYDLIRHELIFREIETQVQAAQKTHKGSLAAGTAQWGAEQHRINEETMLQMTLNKLAAIGDMVKVARNKDVSMDVVGAVDLFHIKKAKLAEVEHKCEGPVDWWAARLTKITHRAKTVRAKEKSKFELEDEAKAKAAEVAVSAVKEDEDAPEAEDPELVTVIAWPSNDMIADDFVNQRGDFKPKPRSDDDGGGGGSKGKGVEKAAPPAPAPHVTPQAAAHAGRGNGADPVSVKSASASVGDVSKTERSTARHGGRKTRHLDQSSKDVTSKGEGAGETELPVEGFPEDVAAAESLRREELARMLASLLPMPLVDRADAKWQGVTLRGDKTSGTIMGTIKLPRFDYFSVTIVVSKTRPLAVDQGHREDTLTIKTGLDLRKLSVLAVIHNEPNDEGCYRHEVHYRVRGDSFAFCFEWQCESPDALLERRLVVERGFFELYRMEELEVIVPPPEAASQEVRCVSSFVKKLRMMSDTDDTKGLTDLVAAEEAPSKFFDSDWIHMGYPQRYKQKRDFIKMVKREMKERSKKRAADQAAAAEEMAEAIAAEQGAAKQFSDDASMVDSTTGQAKDPAASAPPHAGKIDRKTARLEMSKRAYQMRKRQAFQPEVDAAMAFVGKKIEVLLGTEWQRSIVAECRVDWVDGGTVPQPLHKIVPVDESERKCGPVSWEDLAKRRWYERRASILAEGDEEAAARFKMNEARRLRVIEERKLEAEALAAKLEAREEWVDGLLDAEKDKRVSGLAAAAAQFEAYYRRIATSHLAREIIQVKTNRIIADFRIGHGTSSGLPEKIGKASAKNVATTEYVTEQTEKEMVPVIAEWGLRQGNLDEFVADQRRRWAVTDATNAERSRRIERKRETELLQLRAGKTRDLRLRLTLPAFDKLVPHAKAANCEHLRCRSWGDCYGKGVRCIACGQEMSRTHESAKQQAGIGSGDDSTLIEQVTRHRKNEASYRFRNRAELVRVETERVRLEKDRRELELLDPLFYDFVDPEFIYQLDRRHRIELKGRNVVRQGVQWREAEMQEARAEIAEEVEAMTDPAKRKAREEEVSQWNDEQSPPTFRLVELKHRASFRQMIQTHGRISNYRQRIGELEQTLRGFKEERDQCVHSLDELHRSIFSLERDMNAIEADLEGAATTIAIDNASAKQLKEAKQIEYLAAEDLRENEMGLVGAREDADAAEKHATALSATVTEVLRRRVVAQRRLAGLLKRTKIVRRRANAMLPARSDAAREVHSMHYRRYGVVVPTPYGYCRVLVYREEDQMLMCQLPFGKPKAKLYIPLAIPMQLEKAKEESERIMMERDEEGLRQFYAWEKAMRRSEYDLMNAEERTLRDHFRRVDEAAAEDRAIVAAVEQGDIDARRFLDLSEGRRLIEQRSLKLLDEEVRQRDRDIKAWRGVGKIPKKLTLLEKHDFMVKQEQPQIDIFIAEQRALSLIEAQGQVSARHRRFLEQTTVSFVFDLFVAEAIMEVGKEEMSKDVEAKRRVEAETGLYFPDPKHMTFEVYSTLARWWNDEKKLLRSNLERWGAANVQDRLRSVTDAEKAAARKRNLESSAKKLAAFEAQQVECEAMFIAEAEVRKVYRFELKNCLRERRAMKDEEAATRHYNHELKLIEATKASNKYAIKGMAAAAAEEDNSMSAKERRRLELKKSGVDKQRLARERESMALEDQASMAMRFEEQKRAQLEVLKQQMALMGAPGGDEELEADPDETHVSVDPEVRARIKREREAHARAAKDERKRSEDEAKAKFEAIKRDAHCKAAKIELAWMELEEEARRAEAELDEETANLRRLNLIAQTKGQEELRAKATARKKRRNSDKRIAGLKAAKEWHIACSQQVDKNTRTRQRVYKDTKFMDTTAVAGTSGFYFQRLTAINLHDILTRQYFEKLLTTITNRAELLATERKLVEVANSTQHANRALRAKLSGLAEVWAELRRSEYLRLKRSDLGKKMFGRWQGTLMGAAFKGWVQFWMWNQGVRSAFQLDYATLKHSLDIQRLRGEQREFNERKAGTVTEDYTSNTAKLDAQLKVSYSRKPHVPRSLLQRHVVRPVKCRHCSAFFLEAQNHSIACPYHPGEYKAACPAWCPGLTPKCSSHRAKRWNCCDVRELGKFGSTGCKQRFHMPVEVDPAYKVAVDEKTEFFENAIAEADAKLEVIAQNDVKDAARKIKLVQLDGIAAEVDKEREVVKRAVNFNFSEEVLQSYATEVREKQASMKLGLAGASSAVVTKK